MTISSEILMKELKPVADVLRPDIFVRLRPVKEPDRDLENTLYWKFAVLNPEFFYFTRPEFARYSVKKDDGVTYIDIDFFNEEERHTMMAYFYGSVLTAAMQLNNRFAIHSSGVVVDGKLHLFCGESGIGKSTIAAQLKTRGYPVFTDDKCVLRWDEKNDRFWATPSLRIMRLWKDASENLEDQSFLKDPQRVAARFDKHQYIIDKDHIVDEEKPIEAFYIIRNAKKDRNLNLHAIHGFRKVRNLSQQTHRYQYIKGLGKQMEHWKFLEKLCNRVRMYNFLRPMETPIETFADYVEQVINDKNPNTINAKVL